jgi:hypothetical protein
VNRVLLAAGDGDGPGDAEGPGDPEEALVEGVGVGLAEGFGEAPGDGLGSGRDAATLLDGTASHPPSAHTWIESTRGAYLWSSSAQPGFEQ